MGVPEGLGLSAAPVGVGKPDAELEVPPPVPPTLIAPPGAPALPDIPAVPGAPLVPEPPESLPPIVEAPPEVGWPVLPFVFVASELQFTRPSSKHGAAAASPRPRSDRLIKFMAALASCHEVGGKERP